jgi:DNA-binding IclR family transcriptional regulator
LKQKCFGAAGVSDDGRQREVDLVAGNSHERGQSVVGRLLRILESFSPERTELTILEISRRAGLPSSTVYRLLAELIDRGVIERTADGRYSVGLRLWEMGKLAPRVERLIDVASPPLRDLYEATRANLHLAVRAGHEALVVVAVCGHACVEPVAREGRRVPLTSTTIGQVLLAYSPPQALDQVVGMKAESGTDGSAASPGNGLRGVLAGIRRCGVAVARADGELVVAVPVFGPPGVAVAALALYAPDGGSPSMVPMVWTAAQRISRELLGPDAAPPSGEGPGRPVGPGRMDSRPTQRGWARRT